MPTVTVERRSENVVKMTWASKVADKDVKQSFQEINIILTESDRPMFVVVDILANPSFPITATLTGALFGPYRNSNLREWLIIGSNTAAQFIERTLSSASGRTIVRWFDSEAEVEDYVNQAVEGAA